MAAGSDASATGASLNPVPDEAPEKLGKLARAARTCHPVALRNALKHVPKGSAEGSAELNEALFEIASRCEDPVHLETLVSHRADINARDHTQRTPLHTACAPTWVSSQAAVHSRRERGAEMVEWLLANKADPGASDKAGYTALHAAAFVGDDAGARSLLAWRADPNAQTLRGATPLELIETTCWSGRGSQAQCEQHGNVVAVLTGAGGRSGLAAKSSPAAEVDSLSSSSRAPASGCPVS
eukprot:CAMPEP_0203971636 /NCGR_PEP_ID=MMETSP0359-20131031/98579_1 /ASSEMBLY_ACC=CAM_ASM_000338 /TAXON_ID=268821 /ORGANISM="Scrippsiella Hangoei, Strain SHTV-5" /LENGTH=239 /DNA_ID=CAMNT_0050909619 /DNA_START=25 /DNA_END=744 /DNA_ORIENTATION=+